MTVRGQPTYHVSALERGTVLDHLRAGSALAALRVLHVPAGVTVTVGIHLASPRLGRKDLVKIAGYELTAQEAAKVALLSPDATFSIIRDFQVVSKRKLEPPASFRGLLRCPNAACIVHQERVPGAFRLEARDPIRVRCDYCERSVPEEQFDFV